MRKYIFEIGKDVDVLRELIAKYITLVFLRTQGFEIIYPTLKNAKYLWTALAATHIIAEKNGKRFAIAVKYGKAKLNQDEKSTILSFKKANCIPTFLQVNGDINKDRWQIGWKEL
ncbi:MAG: hypothetical protein QMD14_03280 [Candidatus Aenigmarchaeota archaeon]|nr:hypothetical protein [Candidatus Aenigmarchaeota archaeon]